VLYAEWLWLVHGTRYTRLPDWLVGLDVATLAGEVLPVAVRDRLLRDAGLVAPPVLFEGVLATPQRAVSLLGPSRFGAERAEGVVVRRLAEDPPRIAKLVAAGHRQRSDAEWRRRRERQRAPA